MSHPSVRPSLSFRPDLRARDAGARSGRQGWPVFGPLARSVLDGCEHDGMIDRVGGPVRYSSSSMQVRTLRRKYSSFLRP